MSNQSKNTAEDSPDQQLTVTEVEVLEVRPNSRSLLPVQSALPVVQAAAVAATGFAIGAATAVAVGRLRSRKVASGSARTIGSNDQLRQIGQTRSFLADIQLLDRPE